MARPPENDFPEEIVSDREIQPLASNQARIPTAFFIIAGVVGLLVLILLQLFGGKDNKAQVAEKPVFRPPVEATVPLPRPTLPDPVQRATDDDDDDDDDSGAFNRLNLLEIERMRQMALLAEQEAKLKEAERAAAEAERNRRLKSSMIMVDRGVTPTPSNENARYDDTFSSGGRNNLFPDENDRNELNTNKSNRFQRDVIADEKVVKARAVKLANQDTLLTQGTFISGVLETMINSDLPGMARAIVDKPVYGRTGNEIVVPKGSRLIGRYQSGIDIGQSRVYIVWTRLERPDGVVINLGSPGTDGLGQAGLGGKVDNHFFERFGAATMFSALGPALGALLDNGNRSRNTQEIIDGGQEGFERSAEIVLRQSINIPPTIRVPQGTEITIFVNRDLSFNNILVEK